MAESSRSTRALLRPVQAVRRTKNRISQMSAATTARTNTASTTTAATTTTSTTTTVATTATTTTTTTTAPPAPTTLSSTVRPIAGRCLLVGGVVLLAPHRPARVLGPVAQAPGATTA